MQQKINVGLCGFGTVGSGVVQILENHKEEIVHQVGCPIEVKRILVNDMNKKREGNIPSSLLTDQVDELVQDPEIDVIVEVMGGIEDTYKVLEKAIQNKKHIVTANKDMMAVYGSPLLQLANENQCDVRYEASVAGGIPIIRSLTDGLASDRINKIMGIVNGTTNYILTKMIEEDRTFEDVLKEAQDLGYAEADPSSDVDGLDAARKVSLLSTLAFSMPVELDDVDVRGIRGISFDDLSYAEQLGYTVKLLGIAARNEGKIEMSVQPTLVPHSHPLASIKDEYNAVYVYGDAVGETMFYGPGAGQLPTATAVVSDLMDVVKNIRLGVTGKSSVNPQFDKSLKSSNEVFSKFFLRLEAEDEAGTFLAITNVFARQNVSMDKILQMPKKDNSTAEIVLVTHQASREQIDVILHELEELDVIKGVHSYYRVEGEGEA
ncbi:homoserine dehydrogenase [Pontibacillus yanchengensis]|uniref:Homoserine dehydrogenase n=2 Tax=Pontibacillus yanchengensis TaxID=462910 RepID=A0ACC7VK55_9BACI|nr:homoserine dehydrogenase [Pontibacillus yanchengensis]MYL33746.1 homoserine dehydrogenase [Pontibacillus yanchengensis]MYL55356.1 homoserine dehydrogenase [Pontibacillus yanchengensis]